jgi:8-oxo-dGDP phosphatase
LGTLEVALSTVNHRCTVFLATGLTQGEPRRDVEEQGMVSRWFAREEVEQMVRDGEMTDAKSIAALTLLAHAR